MSGSVIWTNGRVAIEGRDLWMVPYEYNVLCRYNINNGVLEHYSVWDDVHCQVAASYNVINFNNMIIEVPARENKIRLVCKDELVKEYEIAKETKLEHYSQAVVVGDKLLLFPLEKNTIIEIDEKEIQEIPCPVNGISCACVYDGYVFYSNNDNCIWKYDTSTHISEKIELHDEIQVCWIEIWKKNIILFSQNGKVLLAKNGNLNDLKKIASAPEGDFFSTGIIHENILILFQMVDATRIWRLNLNEMSIEYDIIEKDTYWLDWPYNAFAVPVEKNGKIYVMSPKHRALFIYDIARNVLERKHLLLDKSTKVGFELLKQQLKLSKIVNECDLYTLDNCLAHLSGEIC